MADLTPVQALGYFKNKENAYIAPVESSTTASQAHATGDRFWLNGNLYIATADIALGGTITVGTNCSADVLGDDVSELKSAVDYIGAVNITLEDGGISSTDGSDASQTSPQLQKRTNYFEVAYKSQVTGTLVLSTNKYRSLFLYGYDANKNYVGRVAYIDGGNASEITLTAEIDNANIAYCRFSFSGYDLITSFDVDVYASGSAILNQVATVYGTKINDVKKPSGDLNLVYSNVRPDNLYNADEIITGFYINNSGVQTASATWCCTPFVDIHEYSEIQTRNVGLSAWYNSSKTFISTFVGGNNLYEAPENAYYLRSSVQPANLDTAVISYNGRRATSEDCAVTEWAIEKKGFQSGYITFTVPVNQTVATYANTDETNNEGTAEYIDVDCVLSLPYEYKPIGKPCKLLMMCHGAGRGVTGDNNWTTVEGYNTLVELFTSRGYAVFDCNGFKNNVLGWSFWGNQRGLEAWRKAYLYVTNNYNVEETFSIYAFSMGGLTAMNLAFQGFPNINAIALGSPVLNLEKVFDATDGTKAVLQTLYGLGDTWDDSKVIGNNPWKRIITIDNTAMLPYKLPPIKIWYGSTETENASNPAIEKEYARQFVNAITACGNYAYYREVSGAGHSICYGSSSVVNTEILTYLQRYEMSRTLTYN